ncbi:hypothetical protein Glove_117g492 [Diversispora epigaea]|uniref:Uncharacterized protein n=1 Tax=Diversispora epigaea TaxID=1348612 RepID=A0A397J130_9GLOM|nr:hypothetical protein Glove_117g492 [Diversispora epigaea]
MTKTSTKILIAISQTKMMSSSGEKNPARIPAVTVKIKTSNKIKKDFMVSSLSDRTPQTKDASTLSIDDDDNDDDDNIRSHIKLHIVIQQKKMVTSGKKKPRNDNVNVKIKISNKIKRVIVTLLKISVAYKNKGGKIIKSAKKVIVAISFLLKLAVPLQ